MLSFIQHNKQPNLFLLKTRRLNSLVLYRTSSLKVLWLLTLDIKIRYVNIAQNNHFFFHTLWLNFYINDFFLYFQNFIKTSLGLMTLNLTKSCYYWNIRVMDNILKYTRVKKVNNDVMIKNHNVELYRPVTTVNFSFHKKIHDTTIVLFYFILTDTYNAFYQDFKLYYSFILVPNNFHLLNFINCFYFKLRHF